MPPEMIASVFPSAFTQGLIATCIYDDADLNIKKQEGQETYFFEGYPSGNYLKQVCAVLSLWMKLNKFPILF